MPRRRRGARAVAIEADEPRGFLVRALLHSPRDAVAGALALAAVIAILVNALLLQAGHHPSPMFGTVVTLPPPQATALAVNPLPRPRPAEATARPADLLAPPPETKPAETKAVETRPVEKSVDKGVDPMTNLVVKSINSPAGAPSNVVRPPASIPAVNQTPAARRIASVQRTLTEYGYGQLKPTGAVGADTQNAISKFERDRKLPVTGQMSDRLVRELTAMVGHPIE